MTTELTQEIAYKWLTSFFRKKPMVIFGTGTSCALDPRFGMAALKDCLQDEVPKTLGTSAQRDQWQAVVDALDHGDDLEAAMNPVTDNGLIASVTAITADFVGGLDRDYACKLMCGEAGWPATRLFKRMVDGLVGADRALHVATPNYDLLLEYALENEKIPYITGFVGGVCRDLDWPQCEEEVACYAKVADGKKLKRKRMQRKHIRLYKVHGSLNTFVVNGRIVQNNCWMADVPDHVERVMITPGVSKYERLHAYRTDLLGPFDSAVADHSAFLFVGFGFNDSQLNNQTLFGKLKEQKNHGLIITRDANPRIDEYLAACENLWLVCRYTDGGREGTRICNSRYSQSLYLDGIMLWKTDEFAEEILGG